MSNIVKIIVRGESQAEPPAEDLPTYFVKNGGNDSADGLSDETAWATVSKAISTSPSPGESIGFKCGDTWRESIYLHNTSFPNGTNADRITFRSYGTGAKPLFLQSYDASSGWSVYSGNVWQKSGFGTEVVALHMDADTIHGVRRAGTGSCTVQGDFYYSGGVVYLYSVGDPGSFYDNIEAAHMNSESSTSQSGFQCGTKNYITVSGLEFKYGGIRCYTNTGMTVEYNDVSWVGPGSAGSPAGNGIGGQAAAYSVVRYNRVHQCLDAGLSRINNSVDGGLTHTELYGNVVSNTEYGYEQQSYDTGNYDNVNIHDNVFFGGGYTIWHDYRDAGDKYGNGFQSWNHTSGTVTPSNCEFDNNLVYGPRLYNIRIPGTGWTADGNRYYPDGAAMFGKYGVADYNFAGWQAVGYDALGSLLDEISGTDEEIIAALEAML